jgi:hypothetical protein
VLLLISTDSWGVSLSVAAIDGQAPGLTTIR